MADEKSIIISLIQFIFGLFQSTKEAPKPEVKPEPLKEEPKEEPAKTPESPKPEPKLEGPRRISDVGVNYIKAHEGLELEAYPDPASPLGTKLISMKMRMRAYKQLPDWNKLSGAPWTIGYGHTGPEVKQGMAVTESESVDILRKDLAKFEAGVIKLVKVELNDNQFAALVSFAFNCGLANLEKSTLLKKVNLKDFAGAAEEFLKWNKAQGKELPGLTKRRAEEKALFLS